MKEVIMALIMAVSAETGVDLDAGYRELPSNHKAVAQHAVAPKSGNHYLLFNHREMKKLTTKQKKAIIVHEMAHGQHLEVHGKHSHRHRSDWQKICRTMAKDAGVNVAYACAATH